MIKLATPESFDLKAFCKVLKYLPRVELMRICKESGMNEREIYGVVSFIYDGKSVSEIAETLNVSLSKYNYRKKQIALQLYNHMKLLEHPFLQ